MVKLFLFFTTSFFVYQAQADIIKCNYTEPFYSTQYSMAQQSLTVFEMDGNTTVYKNVSFQIMGAGHFEMWDADKNVLQVVTLDFAGSDLMSDKVYPYSATATTIVSGMGNQFGGCTSNFLHAD